MATEFFAADRRPCARLALPRVCTRFGRNEAPRYDGKTVASSSLCFGCSCAAFVRLFLVSMVYCLHGRGRQVALLSLPPPSSSSNPRSHHAALCFISSFHLGSLYQCAADATGHVVFALPSADAQCA
ncbi:hypothetical protein AMAG_18839 [Allomyces macrogynus ATCC 38327]|uniref:Uncharacterized protein n=1 Tax=Allomyces macrogynus (strain ATCC 38327) TaxID=578462 RepID=A0A0L0SIK7_ALLM3|nr:hypothetical protein AMAG_18839 [Allomyces macrogynus ATCC 38327]|eukprot:KNE62284.1 hypothetical protein AMAG_18839 [Allomyces macrogynus ATCC 38327]